MFVCTSCSLGQTGFLETVQDAMAGVEVTGIDCMSGCARDQTVAFRAAGKVAYLFGDITEQDIAELQNFAQLYAESKDGRFADARVLGDLRMKAVARIPA